MSETNPSASDRAPTRRSSLMAGVAGLAVLAVGSAMYWQRNSGTTEVQVPLGAQVAVPSGQDVHYLDTITDAPGQGGITYRFRFVAPAIARTGGTMTAETSSEDMLALCNTYALANLPDGGKPDEIIISLADRPTTFGEAAPEATQFFESFGIADGKCAWQLF